MATAKGLLFCAFLMVFSACGNDSIIDPTGQMYSSGVYKANGGEINIPETVPHTATGLMVTRVTDSKTQTAYAVPNLTKVTITSTAAGNTVATTNKLQGESALNGGSGSVVAMNATGSHASLYSPSAYLPQVEEAIKLREEESLRRSVRAAPYPRNIFTPGEVWYNVNIYNHEYGINRKIDAVCLGVSQHAYFMQDVMETALDSELLAIYMDEFDKNYPKMHNAFGTEGDVDGNGKVIVMLYDFGSETFVGYFKSSDKIETAEKSNFADIFYINSAFAGDIANANQTSAILVHEFQHMIYFDNIKIPSHMYSSATWFNEALSMLAMYICGYYVDGADGYVASFRNTYSTLSLTNWTDNNYGFSLLFGVYFYEHFGKEALKSVYRLNVAGVPAVEAVTGMDFNDIFLDFATALVISKRGYTDDWKYDFGGIDFRRYEGGMDYNLPPANTISAGGGLTGDVPYYGLISAAFSGRTKQIKIGKLFDGRAFLKQ